MENSTQRKGICVNGNTKLVINVHAFLTMTNQEALALIKQGIDDTGKPQVWADLGCGSGTFTNALAHLLAPKSHVFAVDKHPQQLNIENNQGVSVQFLDADFEHSAFDFPLLDGILLANSLHFVEHKEALIKRLEKYLSPKKNFLIIEYETLDANQWVPFPVDFGRLKELFTALGYKSITQLAVQNSVYGQGNLYATKVCW